MGMDVMGDHPDSKAGEYFRANIWAWPPIHNLIVQLCSDLLDDETLHGMVGNDDYGPNEAATCKEMANRFESWMEQNVEGHGFVADAQGKSPDGMLLTGAAFVGPNRTLLTGEGSIEPIEKDTPSPYYVSDGHLKDWIEFLRHCGGFRVA